MPDPLRAALHIALAHLRLGELVGVQRDDHPGDAARRTLARGWHHGPLWATRRKEKNP